MLGDRFDDQEQGRPADEDLMAENRRQDAAADALLVGRRTFEDFRGYWRDLEGDTTGVSDYLTGVAKHVVSSTLTEPDWAGATVLSSAGPDDLVAQVWASKEQPGEDVVCTGSIRLCHALVAAGLVDEYRLFTYPVLQGAGRRLFPDGYGLLLDRLVGAATAPGVTAQAQRPCAQVLPPLVRSAWKGLARRAGALGDGSSDEDRHEVRKRAERVRYVAEAVRPALGRPAKRFARQVERLTEVLGDHQVARRPSPVARSRTSWRGARRCVRRSRTARSGRSRRPLPGPHARASPSSGRRSVVAVTTGG